MINNKEILLDTGCIKCRCQKKARKNYNENYEDTSPEDNADQISVYYRIVFLCNVGQESAVKSPKSECKRNEQEYFFGKAKFSNFSLV